jgi:hypothetical protein
VDYSVKEASDFGDYTLVERAGSPTIDLEVRVAISSIYAVYTKLASYKAKPIVYVGNEAAPSTVIYGILKDLEIELDTPDYALLTISILGLT